MNFMRAGLVLLLNLTSGPRKLRRVLPLEALSKRLKLALFANLPEAGVQLRLGDVQLHC